VLIVRGQKHPLLTVDITAGASTTVNTETMSQYPVLNFSHRHRRPVRIVTLLIVVSRDGLVRRAKKLINWSLTGIHNMSLEGNAPRLPPSNNIVEFGDKLAAMMFDWWLLSSVSAL